MAGGGEGETGGSGGGFAFTLSLKGKVGQKAAVQVTKETVRKDFVSGISGSTINSLNPKEAAGPRVIPKLENTFKVGTLRSLL